MVAHLNYTDTHVRGEFHVKKINVAKTRVFLVILWCARCALSRGGVSVVSDWPRKHGSAITYHSLFLVCSNVMS